VYSVKPVLKPQSAKMCYLDHMQIAKSASGFLSPKTKPLNRGIFSNDASDGRNGIFATQTTPSSSPPEHRVARSSYNGMHTFALIQPLSDNGENSYRGP